MAKTKESNNRKDVLAFMGFLLLTEGGGSILGYLMSGQFGPDSWLAGDLYFIY